MLLRWVSEADLPALYAALVAIRPRARPAPARSPTSPPAPAPTPASSASRRRARWRPSSAAQLAASRHRPTIANAQGPAHQGQRLLQLVRPAPRRRPRLPRRQPQRRRAPRAALPAGRRRAVGRTTAAPTAWRSAPCRRSACPRSSSASPARYAKERSRARVVRGLRHPHRQEDDPRDGRGAAGAADLRAGPELLHRLGRSARVHHRRHGRRRVRGRGRPATSRSTWRRAERELFEAQVLLDERQGRRTPPRAPTAPCCRRRGRWPARRTRTWAPTPDEIVGEFRKHFYDTQLFFDPFAGGKFAQYLFRAHDEHDKASTAGGGAPADRGGDAVRRRRPPVLHPPRLVAGRPHRRRRRRPRLKASCNAHKLQLKIFTDPDSARAVDPRPSSRSSTAGSSSSSCPS